MAFNDIETREDIFKVVDAFYKKVREDDIIGSIFNKLVEDWDSHLQTITNFWETILFSNQTYRGNPMAVHMSVDKATDHSLTQPHFNRWVALWLQTVDTLYKGEKSETAKQRASNIANIMFIKIYQARG